ncbi:MAG: flagellar basal body L-ring protein FlgH [Myxococcales bacterium]|nr:flagellar basal body L-ring protein FlgH [Myxococcales bacterium]MCB9579349.1 flagellar basal body L-ring protein FlgH [Polyangiaceae bacterium]
MTKLWLAVLVALTLSACGPPHIRPFTPRHRKYEAGEYAATQKDYKPATGSIYSEAQAGYLEDTRALRVGDVVLVRINEEADAKGGATTKLAKGSSREANVSALLGLVPAIKKAYPNIDPENLLQMASQFDFAGEGNTQRAGKLRGMIGVHVKKELPNGDLFVEGTKVVMINHEEYHLYISGVIRPSDIEQDNSVPSTRIADARVEFTGRGDVADQVERGWLTKLLDSVNPF